MNPEGYNQVVYPRQYQDHWDYVKGHCEICDTDMGEFDATVNVDRCPGCNFFRGMLCATCKAKPRPKTYIEERHAACEAEFNREFRDAIIQEPGIKGKKALMNRDGYLKRKYGISLVDSRIMWEKEERMCRACYEPLPVFDGRKTYHHQCKKCGVVRAILCNKCMNDLRSTKKQKPSFIIDYRLMPLCKCRQ
jgi:hypothetical protein